MYSGYSGVQWIFWCVPVYNRNKLDAADAVLCSKFHYLVYAVRKPFFKSFYFLLSSISPLPSPGGGGGEKAEKFERWCEN